MRKKFLAGLLSFAMVFSPMPPTAVFAENDGEHTLQMETQVVDQEEPVVEDDAKGVGPFLLAYTELLRYEKN